MSPEQNDRHLGGDIFKCISWRQIRICIINFVPNGSVDNIWTLLQVMVWRRPGKPIILTNNDTVRRPMHIHPGPPWVKGYTLWQVHLLSFSWIKFSDGQTDNPFWGSWITWAPFLSFICIHGEACLKIPNPPTPLCKDNACAHFTYSMTSSSWKCSAIPNWRCLWS